MSTPGEPATSPPNAPSDGTTRTPFKTPDITPAQIVAFVTAACSLAAAFGLDISHEKRDALVQLGIALPGILMFVDSIIRHGRSKVAVAQINAAADAAWEEARAAKAANREPVVDEPHVMQQTKETGI